MSLPTQVSVAPAAYAEKDADITDGDTNPKTTDGIHETPMAEQSQPASVVVAPLTPQNNTVTLEDFS